MKFKPLRAESLFDISINIAIAILLGWVAWYAVSQLSLSLRVAWFWTSDENVVLAEVIRFSNLNFYQTFFDMPGTPLMLFGAAEWRLYYFLAAGLHGFPGGIDSWTFQHLQRLFTLMRADSLAFFLLSAILLFRIAAKSMNRFAGAAAVLLLLMNESYEETVPSVRVEPIAMCFLLAAVLVLTEFPQLWGSVLAGVLAGLGAATRLHSITASLPLLILLLLFRNWNSTAAYSKIFARFVGIAGAIALAVALALFYFFAFNDTPWIHNFPYAFALFKKASLAGAALILLLGVLYFVPRARSLVVNGVTTRSLLLVASIPIGLLLGAPTALLRYDAFLASVNFYASGRYSDLAAAQLPLLEKLTSEIRFYIPLLLPNIAAICLFSAGAVLIACLARWRALAPYLIVSLAFFVSKPLDLVRAPHHAALWIPLYAIVCAVPIAEIAALSHSRFQIMRYVAPLVAAASLMLLLLSLPNAPKSVRGNIADHMERTHNIASADDWISQHGPEDRLVMVDFYCFDPDVFYDWFRRMNVPMPEFKQKEHHELWWGNASALKGNSGIACLSPRDLSAMKDWGLRTPGEGLDPWHDARFTKVQAFGQGSSEIDLFEFDFRRP